MSWSKMTEQEADALEATLAAEVTKKAPCPLCGKGPVTTPDASQGHVCEDCGQSWSCAHDPCPPEWWNDDLRTLIQRGQVWRD